MSDKPEFKREMQYETVLFLKTSTQPSAKFFGGPFRIRQNADGSLVLQVKKTAKDMSIQDIMDKLNEEREQYLEKRRGSNATSKGYVSSSKDLPRKETNPNAPVSQKTGYKKTGSDW